MASSSRDRYKGFEGFKMAWNQMDEQTKEALAGGLYVLAGPNEKARLAHEITRSSMSEKSLELLTKLAEYAEEN